MCRFCEIVREVPSKRNHKVYGYTSIFFSAIFSKADNFRDFLYAYLEEEVYPVWVLLLRKEMGANSFLFEMTQIHMGGNNENDKSCFPQKCTHSPKKVL